MTWEIFLGIGALLSFIIAVTGPMMKLNTSITKLNDSVDVLKTAIERIEDDNEKNRKKIWEHNDSQDDKIENHEQRITKIETKMDIMHPESK